MLSRAPEDTAISDESIEQLARDIAAAALAKKGHDVAILDLRELVSFTDFFVCASANNARQVRAIVSAAREAARASGVTSQGSEGAGLGRWVLCDFGDVVLHVFDRDMRGFYDLDGLWRDAPRLELPDVPAPPPDDDDDLDDIEEDDLGPVFRLT